MTGLVDLTEPRPESPAAFLRRELGFKDQSQTTKPANIRRLAAAMGVSRETVYHVLTEKRVLTPDMALRFERVYAISSVRLMEMAAAVALWDTGRQHEDLYPSLKVLRGQKLLSVLIHQDECDVFRNPNDTSRWVAQYRGDRFPVLKKIGFSQIGRTEKKAFLKLRQSIADRIQAPVG